MGGKRVVNFDYSGKNWVTSDTHFYHENIIKFSGRPFTSFEQMNKALIDRHNALVKKGDRVFHLGDFSWKQNVTILLELFDALNGNEWHFLFGNHDDEETVRKVASRAYDEIGKRIFLYDYLEASFDGTKVVMFHYPMESWNWSFWGSWHLFGHVHAKLPMNQLKRMDVGVDTNKDLVPYNLIQIADLMKNRQNNTI